MFKLNNNRLMMLLVSLFLFGVISLLYYKTQIFDGLENQAIDYRFYLRDPSQKSKKIQEGVHEEKINPRVNENILIVGIDNETITEMNNIGIQWPFPWNTHAAVTKYISSGKPNTIVFDIMFLENKPFESELAQTFKDAGNVIIDYPFETSEIEAKHQDFAERMRILSQYELTIQGKDTTGEWVEDVTPPTAAISKAAKGIGFANIRPDLDTINRKMPMYVKFKNKYYPSLDLLVVMNYYGISKDDIEIYPSKFIRLKNLPAEKMKKLNPEHSIDIPIDEYGNMDINFAGGTGSFTNFPYLYFNREGTEPENSSFKDKIVLIAAYASTGMAIDEHNSPYNKLFGIEHHANAINTIINQDFITKFKTWQNIIIFMVIALIFGIIIPMFSRNGGSVLFTLLTLIFSVTLSLAYLITAYILFDSKSLIYAVYVPIIQIGLNFTLIVVYRLLTEQKEKKYIRQTFSKFVSKSVVDELLKYPEKVKLGGEKKILSVLFSDIRGFTSMSETITPEQLVEHLNEYLQVMTDIVIQYDGTLDKYVGDEIMAFWGAPIPQDDHALRCCKAAIEMIAVLERLNKHWESIGKHRLDIGIGINTGEMIVGNMGSTSRMNYTLMGDMVNLGARLEGTNKVYRTQIIISEFTYEHVKNNVVVRELDLIRVKGKAQPVKIYELLDIK